MAEGNTNNIEKQAPNFDFKKSNGKLVFLAGLAVFLSSVTPFVPFAPAPLALAFLIFGLSKTLIAGGIFTAVLFMIAMFSSLTPVNGLFYLCALFCAWIVQKIIRSKQQPHLGLFKYGFLIIGLGVAFYGVATNLGGYSIQDEMVKAVNVMTEQIKNDQGYQAMLAQGGEQARAVQDLIQKPEEAAKQMLTWLPAGFFVFVFFTMWVTIYMVLRNGLVWRKYINYPFGLTDFLRFRAPYYFVYPLILGLALVAGGDYLFGSETAQLVGYNVLYCLGIFYLFQGVGVLVDFLNYVKIGGFFRNMLIIFSILVFWRILAFVGLFDGWINFRKFFKNKNHEGEIS